MEGNNTINLLCEIVPKPRFKSSFLGVRSEPRDLSRGAAAVEVALQGAKRLTRGRMAGYLPVQRPHNGPNSGWSTCNGVRWEDQTCCSLACAGNGKPWGKNLEIPRRLTPHAAY